MRTMLARHISNLPANGEVDSGPAAAEAIVEIVHQVGNDCLNGSHLKRSTLEIAPLHIRLRVARRDNSATRSVTDEEGALTVPKRPG